MPTWRDASNIGVIADQVVVTAVAVISVVTSMRGGARMDDSASQIILQAGTRNDRHVAECADQERQAEESCCMQTSSQGHVWVSATL